MMDDGVGGCYEIRGAGECGASTRGAREMLRLAQSSMANSSSSTQQRAREHTQHQHRGEYSKASVPPPAGRGDWPGDFCFCTRAAAAALVRRRANEPAAGSARTWPAGDGVVSGATPTVTPGMYGRLVGGVRANGELASAIKAARSYTIRVPAQQQPPWH